MISNGKRLDGKVAVVIGAGSSGPGWGNGKATAVTFARQGAQVVCVDRNLTAANETKDIIEAENCAAIAHQADVTREDEVKDAVHAALDKYGRIDILDNNVGIAEVGSVVDLAVEDWDRVHDVNLKSAYLVIKHVIPEMTKHGGGSIINISSVAGIRYTGVPYLSYYTSKAALNHMTRSVAAEFAPKHIRVNAILPGMMKTPMVSLAAGITEAYGEGDVEEMWRRRDAACPMGHMGDAWDVANAALFLASDESKYITGLELIVDGGLTLGYA